MPPRHANAVYSYVCSRLAPRIDRADDVVQEVFLAAWENLSEYRGNSTVESWLIGIARHKIEDYYRARLREPEPLELVEENPQLEALGLDFDDLLDRETLQKQTRQVLDKLPEHYRSVLISRYWNECSVGAMAALTGRTEKAIERLLARARIHFRLSWNQEWKRSGAAPAR
jgi:RNA polymerase sigma-70 factor (ECF subfamily)